MNYDNVVHIYSIITLFLVNPFQYFYNYLYFNANFVTDLRFEIIMNMLSFPYYFLVVTREGAVLGLVLDFWLWTCSSLGVFRPKVF